MNQKYEKYLPIGSVVLLNNGSKRLMICGFCISPKGDQTKVFDYIGVLYPEGMIDSEQSILFNHNDIKQIFAIGFSDEEEKTFKIQLKEALNSNEN